MTDRIKALEDALRPFSRVAGEMFARNWNRDDVAILFDGGCEEIRLTFADFLSARAAIAASQPAPGCHQPDLVTAEAAQPVTVQDAARVPEVAALIEAGKAASLFLAEHEPYPLTACQALAVALRAIEEGRA